MKKEMFLANLLISVRRRESNDAERSVEEGRETRKHEGRALYMTLEAWICFYAMHANPMRVINNWLQDLANIFF